MIPLKLVGLLILISFVLGMWYDKFIYRDSVEEIFKRFRDEMHVQYMFLLKRHGIKLTDEAEEELKKHDDSQLLRLSNYR